ncbi:MAG: hypothetical protein Kow0074_13480 [Candidatus Zixiibacteriota bacterium]
MTLIRLRSWPPYLRYFVAAFVLVGLAGYAAGLAYLVTTTGAAPDDIADHYHGNEAEMSFGKSTGEMLTIIHAHLLGMGVLFLAVGMFFAVSDFPVRWKGPIMVETMLSLFTTFGGLYLVSIGWRHWLWLVYPSSILMVVGYVTMSVAILSSSFRPLGDRGTVDPT